MLVGWMFCQHPISTILQIFVTRESFWPSSLLRLSIAAIRQSVVRSKTMVWNVFRDDCKLLSTGARLNASTMYILHDTQVPGQETVSVQDSNHGTPTEHRTFVNDFLCCKKAEYERVDVENEGIRTTRDIFVSHHSNRAFFRQITSYYCCHDVYGGYAYVDACRAPQNEARRCCGSHYGELPSVIYLTKRVLFWVHFAMSQFF